MELFIVQDVFMQRLVLNKYFQQTESVQSKTTVEYLCHPVIGLLITVYCLTDEI